jgi:DNA-binding transcriptional MocR family regulator
MISKTTPDRSLINLQGGWPTPRLHPVEALQSATQDLFAQGDIHEALKYGPEYGDASLRENIGKWLADAYQPSAGPIGRERIIATNGASNGLATVLQKFADPVLTRNIWMVEPAYFLACPIFRDAGFTGKIRGVPEGTGCIDLDFFQAVLDTADKTAKSLDSAQPTKTPKNGYPKIFRHILYMVPTFSNPSGKTMSMEHREKLVQIARDYDVLIVTDDVYDLLSWSVVEGDDSKNSTCLPRLVDVDRSLPGTNEFGNAVSNGSFSKIVAPGVRLGWLEATPSFISAMGTV